MLPLFIIARIFLLERRGGREKFSDEFYQKVENNLRRRKRVSQNWRLFFLLRRIKWDIIKIMKSNGKDV